MYVLEHEANHSQLLWKNLIQPCIPHLGLKLKHILTISVFKKKKKRNQNSKIVTTWGQNVQEGQPSTQPGSYIGCFS